MAETHTVDIVEKLIRLATNNPSPEEAKLAALKACELIQKFSIPLGADVVIVKDKEWTPPSSDFMNTVDDILKGTKTAYDDQVKNEEQTPGLMIQDRDLVTREEAFRKQMQRAWQAIRAERKRFESWVYKVGIETKVWFWDNDHPKPW